MATAEFTAARFRQAVKYLMRDPSGLAYTDARIDEAYTRALRRVAQLHRCYRRENTANFTALTMQQSTGSLGTVIEVEQVVTEQNGMRWRLRPGSPEDGLDKRPITGVQTRYWLQPPNVLWIFEAPATADSRTIGVRAIPTETAWVIGTPVELEQRIVSETVRELMRPERSSEGEELWAEDATRFGEVAETAVSAMGSQNVGVDTSASVTFSSLFTLLRRELGDPNAKRWTSAELVFWYSSASRDYAARTDMITAQETVTTVAGTESYVLSDVYRVAKARLKRTATWYDDLRPADEPWPHDYIGGGNAEPSTWWALHNYRPDVSPVGLAQIYFASRPGAVYELDVSGSSLPTWGADEDATTTIPAAFVDGPFPLVMARCFEKYRDWTASRECMRRYDENVAAGYLASCRAYMGAV